MKERAYHDLENEGGVASVASVEIGVASDKRSGTRDEGRWYRRPAALIAAGAIVAASAVGTLAGTFGYAWLTSMHGRPPEFEMAAAKDGAVVDMAAAFPPGRFDVKAEGDALSFLVVGDWGRDGQHGQREVAHSMAAVASHPDVRPDFVISVGDNFYVGGLFGVDDPQFETSFVEMYTATALQVPWLAVLGNMDYGDDGGCGKPREQEDVSCLSAEKVRTRSPDHQLSPALRRKDWRWLAGRYFTVSPRPDVDLIFVDTSPLIAEYANYTWAHEVRGGIAEQDTQEQMAFLERALARGAKEVNRTRIVVGHHPVYSNGFRGGHAELAGRFGPLFDEHGVKAYICGHDHDLQHLSVGNTEYVISGAGSKAGRGFGGQQHTSFQYDGSGFAWVRVDAEGAIVLTFYDAGGVKCTREG